MRCPQCARTVEEGAPFCSCGYPIFWDERAERSPTSSSDDQVDLSRIPDEATIPPPSRRTVEPVEPAEPAPPTERLAPLLVCPDCGTPNPATRTLCQRCGAPLAQADPGPPPAPPPRRRAVVPTPVLVLVVLVLAAAAALWSLGIGRDAGAGEEPADAATPAAATPTAQPSATPSPSPTEPAVVTHVVQQGDTLTTIAQRYGATVEALIQANGIGDPDLITLGQELTIPPPG